MDALIGRDLPILGNSLRVINWHYIENDTKIGIVFADGSIFIFPVDSISKFGDV